MFDGMIMITILFVVILTMGHLINKESKRLQNENFDWIHKK